MLKPWYPAARQAWALVTEIATESPTIPTDNEINICKFCQSPWAEKDYDVYKENPRHEADCLWVRANIIIEGVAK